MRNVFSLKNIRRSGAVSRAQVSQYNLSNVNEAHSVRLITATYPNPNWTMNIPYNDIMVVKLDSVVDNTVLAVLNSDPNIPTSGETLSYLGFGSTVANTSAPQTSSVLQTGATHYVSFANCAVASDPNGISLGTSVNDTGVTEGWLCTLTNNPRVGTCVGDSGSPVIIEGSSASSDLVVGVVSG